MGFFVRLLLVVFSMQLITHGAVHAVNAEEAAFSVQSGGMLPTIAVNSVVSIVPYANISNARRGDVVVFRNPRDNNPWIKRLTGMPGDKIQMIEGRLYINGGIVPRKPIAKVHTEDFYGHEADVPTYRETLPNGISYTIIEIQGDTGLNDNTSVFEVPDGNYFVMGDNRDNSTDSRVAPDQGGVGYVPGRNIIGYVIVPTCSKYEIEIRQIDWRTSDIGVKVVGELFNGCSEDIGVELQLVFRDQNGHVVFAEYPWPASMDNIAARSAYPFMMEFPIDQPFATMEAHVNKVSRW